MNKDEIEEMAKVFQAFERIHPRCVDNDTILRRDERRKHSVSKPQEISVRNRKAMLLFERSNSTANLLQTGTSREHFPISRKTFLEVRSNPDGQNISTSSSPKSVLIDFNIDYLAFNSPTDEMIFTDDITIMGDDTISVRTPRNSVDLLKSKIRHSNQSEDVYNTKSDISSTSTELKSAPESARNSEHYLNSIGELNKLSTDSGISSTIQSNSLPTNNRISSISADVSNNIDSRLYWDFIINDKDLHKEGTEVNDSTDTRPQKKMSSELPELLNSDRPTIKPPQTEKEKEELLKSIARDLSGNKEILKFYLRDGTYTTQVIDKTQNALSVITHLKRKLNMSSGSFCQIVEVIRLDSLERPLEDHESVLDVFYSWEEGNNNRFIFQENSDIYRFFVEPHAYQTEMECDFDISDTLWIKESNSKWKRYMTTCYIMDSNVYFTTKPGSKEYNQLFCLASLKNMNIYSCTDAIIAKKMYKSPSNDLIIFKENNVKTKPKNSICIGAVDEKQKQKWLTALRVAKFSFNKIKANYLNHICLLDPDLNGRKVNSQE